MGEGGGQLFALPWLSHGQRPALTKTYNILGPHSGIGEDPSLLEYDATPQDATRSDKAHPIIADSMA
jgi:hypothetical protein